MAAVMNAPALMSDSVFAVGQTPAQIDLPPVESVIVLNTSEGLGDKPGAANIVVNNSSACSLNPQVGIKLQPGRSVGFPMLNPSNDHPLPLFAVADGPDAQLTVVIEP
jgi:hypothetical protein